MSPAVIAAGSTLQRLRGTLTPPRHRHAGAARRHTAAPTPSSGAARRHPTPPRLTPTKRRHGGRAAAPRRPLDAHKTPPPRPRRRARPSRRPPRVAPRAVTPPPLRGPSAAVGAGGKARAPRAPPPSGVGLGGGRAPRRCRVLATPTCRRWVPSAAADAQAAAVASAAAPSGGWPRARGAPPHPRGGGAARRRWLWPLPHPSRSTLAVMASAGQAAEVGARTAGRRRPSSGCGRRGEFLAAARDQFGSRRHLGMPRTYWYASLRSGGRFSTRPAGRRCTGTSSKKRKRRKAVLVT